MSKNYLLAVATLISMIIGVGIFAIPFAINKAGLLPLFIYMIGLGGIQYFLHLLYAEAVLSTKEKHRIPGLAEKYINRRSKLAAFIIEIIGSYGSILAYIIVGGLFLHQLLSPYWGGSTFIYSTGLFVIVSFITWFGIKMIAGTEFILTTLLILTIGLIAGRGFGFIELSNYHLIDWNYIFLPYGPVFFALGGAPAIPEVCRLLNYEKNKIKSAIAWGTFIAAGLTLFFVLIVLGITGSGTTPDTLSGLSSIMPDGVISLALIFGLLAIVTSYIVTAESVEEIYDWDYKLNKRFAWLLAGFVPYFLYLLGWANFTKVISFSGAVTGGLSGLVLIWLVFKIKHKPEQVSIIKNKLTRPIAYFLSGLFVLGMIYEIWNIFR